MPAHTMAAIGFLFLGTAGWKEQKHTMLKTKSHGGTEEENNVSDAVQCFSCRYIFYNWTHDRACPWTEHASWSGNCEHVRAVCKRNAKRYAKR